MSFPGKFLLVVELLALILIAAGLSGHLLPPLADYSVLKTMHIFGAIVMVGNVIVGPAWVIRAMTVSSDDVRSFSFRSLGWMDVYFTAPGVLLLTVSGIGLANAHGGMNVQPWIEQSAFLTIGMVLVGSSIVLYWQEKTIRAAEEGSSDLRRYFIHWSIWGTLVSIPIVLVLWMMVSKQGVF